MEQKHFLRYLALIMLASWLLQGIAILITGDINSRAAEPWLLTTMLTPLLVTFFYLWRYPAYRKQLYWKPRWSVLPAALMGVLIPTGVALLVTAGVIFLRWGTHPWFTFSKGTVAIHGGPFVLGGGPQHWVVFIVNVLVTGGLFAMMNGVVASGEELAWRGFLQQQLQTRMGTVKGIIVLGFIWSMWHLPAQLAGYNHPDHPLIGSLLISPLELMGVSLYLAWITKWSGSFIPAAIAHGAINGIQEGIISHLHLYKDPLYEDLLTMAMSLMAGVLCIPLLKKY